MFHGGWAFSPFFSLSEESARGVPGERKKVRRKREEENYLSREVIRAEKVLPPSGGEDYL